MEDVGAKLFVGNISADVDEHMVQTMFSRFGRVRGTVTIMRPELSFEGNDGHGTPGMRRTGHAFVRYGSFKESDEAKKALDGVFVGGRPIRVDYAIRQGAANGEKHGSEAERRVAARAEKRRLELAKKTGTLDALSGVHAHGAGHKAVHVFAEHRMFARCVEELPAVQRQIAARKQREAMMAQQDVLRRQQQEQLFAQQQHQQQGGGPAYGYQGYRGGPPPPPVARGGAAAGRYGAPTQPAPLRPPPPRPPPPTRPPLPGTMQASIPGHGGGGGRAPAAGVRGFHQPFAASSQPYVYGRPT